MTSTVRRADTRFGALALNGRTALELLQTVGAGVLGGGCLFYLFSAAGSFGAFGGLVDAWWLPLSIAAVVATGLALITVAVAGRPDVLGRVATVCAVVYLLVTASWFLAWNDPAAAANSGMSSTGIWITMIPELVSIALLGGGRPVAAVVNLVVAGSLSEVVVALAINGELNERVIAQTFWSVAFGGVYLMFGAAAISFARRLDHARQVTVETAQRRVREDLHDVDRRRLDALVHDRIIAFLLALKPGTPEPSVRAAAAGVIDELDHWWDPMSGPSDLLDAREFVQRLRSTTSSLGDAVTVRSDIDPSSTGRFEADVTAALTDATGEAIRNFYRHAGMNASCVVLADVSDDRISVTVADDGVGFDPAATPAGRLGLSFGIRGRMDAVPGGRSSIVSAPGQGARVRLTWDRP